MRLSMLNQRAMTYKVASEQRYGCKGRWHLSSAMTRIDYNDTPVQSQPCREAGARNEGGSVRTTEGLVTRGNSRMLTAAC